MNHISLHRRLTRSQHYRKISGVCSGIALHWEQPIWLVRVLAVASLIFFTTPTAVAYLMAVLLLPSGR
jgi:phage shock protein PspC (stress-responsive transcriptional regulator)